MSANFRLTQVCHLLSELETELYLLEREYSAQRERSFICSDPGPVADSSYIAGMLAGIRLHLDKCREGLK